MAETPPTRLPMTTVNMIQKVICGITAIRMNWGKKAISGYPGGPNS